MFKVLDPFFIDFCPCTRTVAECSRTAKGQSVIKYFNHFPPL